MPDPVTPSARLLLHAIFDGNAELSAAAGGQTAGQLVEGARFVPGPPRAAGQAILAASNQHGAIRLPLEGNHLPERGSLLFWFQPQERFAGGQEYEFDVIDTGDRRGVRVRFCVWKHSTNFIPMFFDTEQTGQHAAFAYKYLAGGKWYHAALAWDLEAGVISSYLFGRPQADQILEGFEPSPPEPELRVGAASMAVADLRIYDRALTGHEIRSLIGFRQGEALADEGLVYGQQRFDVEAIRGELLYENPFDDPASIAEWRMEGPGIPEVIDGRLSLQTGGTARDRGSFVYWVPQDFPESFIAEWDITPVRAGGLCIVFFCARGRDGQDIFDPSMPERDGMFSHYIREEVNCYHISYFRNSSIDYPNCNLRKNSGFYLVDVGPDFVTCRAGATSHVTVVKNRDRVMMLTGGFVSIDFVDDGKQFGPVWGEGKIGFRQMGHTGQCFYENFRVYSVK